jgi:hypothetical protein
MRSFSQGVAFENLRINGKQITNAEEGNIKVGGVHKKYCF